MRNPLAERECDASDRVDYVVDVARDGGASLCQRE
jgi:hypothetical protein